MPSESDASQAKRLQRALTGWSKEQVGAIILAVLMAIVAVAWLEPWVMWATRNAAPERTTPFVSPVLMIVIVLSGALVTRLVAARSDTWKHMAGRVLAAALVAIAATELLSLGVRPPLDYLTGLVKWNGFFSPEVIVLVVAAMLWLRGILIGRADVLREDLESMFYTGIVALVILLVFDAARPLVPFVDLFWSTLTFFIASLLALALVGPEHAHFWQRETSVVRLMLSRYWVLTIGAVIGLILLVALAFAGSAGPEALGVLRQAVLVVITGLAFVLQVIMSIVVQIIFLLLLPFMPLLEQLGKWIGQIIEQIRLPSQLGTNDPTLQTIQTVLSAESIANFTRGLAVLAILLIFVLFFLLVLIRLGHIPTRHSDETRESIASRQLILDQLKRWLAQRRGSSTARPPYLPVPGEDPRSVIRRAYQALLMWAVDWAGKRAPSQTPTRYAEWLDHQSPAHQEPIDTLTALYLRARYADGALTSDEAQAAQEALVRLQATPVIQSPLSED